MRGTGWAGGRASGRASGWAARGGSGTLDASARGPLTKSGCGWRQAKRGGPPPPRDGKGRIKGGRRGGRRCRPPSPPPPRWQNQCSDHAIGCDRHRPWPSRQTPRGHRGPTAKMSTARGGKGRETGSDGGTAEPLCQREDTPAHRHGGPEIAGPTAGGGGHAPRNRDGEALMGCVPTPPPAASRHGVRSSARPASSGQWLPWQRPETHGTR